MDEAATPMTNRQVAWIAHPYAVWERGGDSDRNIEWARSLRREHRSVRKRRSWVVSSVDVGYWDVASVE